ncbi:MAG TPA: hypothetical protein PK939_03605, partial [Bacteroidales bacterium]|nr:hypothetical protein [Bacteroidales bacterium]
TTPSPSSLPWLCGPISTNENTSTYLTGNNINNVAKKADAKKNRFRFFFAAAQGHQHYYYR